MRDNPLGMHMLKSGIHRMFNLCGFEIRLLRNIHATARKERREMERQQWRFLRKFDVKTILDIGANEGQFATLMRTECPDAAIYSFEPLPDVFAILEKTFAGDQKLVPINIGLSDDAGVRAMNRSDFSPSSSLLPMAELHRDEWPQSAGQTQVKVSLRRLDDWATEARVRAQPGLIVKMDVQGHELAVINGGVETIRTALLLIIEVSFYELYEGQPLFAEIHDRLASLGFRYRGSLEQHYSTKCDRILFADAVFENMNYKANHE